VNERDRTHLNHIKDCIAAIRDYTVDGEMAFRNFIAHQYEGVRPSLVWQVIVKDLPALEAHVKALLAP
jgi:uncharacterized protein with HEPN domain